MGLRRVIKRWMRALLDFAEESVPDASRLKQDAEDMLRALDAKADATSLAMALADEAHSKLTGELDNHEALGREAENFFRSKDTEAAGRCVALQLRSADEVKRLRASYEQLQSDAEQLARSFVVKRDDVMTRVQALPQLRDDLRVVEARERVERKLSAFDVESPQRSFDETTREIEIRKRQLANRQLITADPNAEIDRRIKQAVGERVFQEAMEAFRRKVEAEGEVVEATEYRVVEGDDPVAAAYKAIEAPRFAGLLPAAGADRKALPVRRQ